MLLGFLSLGFRFIFVNVFVDVSRHLVAIADFSVEFISAIADECCIQIVLFEKLRRILGAERGRREKIIDWV